MTVNLRFNNFISSLKRSAKVGNSKFKVSKNKFNKDFLVCLYRNGFVSKFVLSEDGFYYEVDLKIKNMFEFTRIRTFYKSSNRKVMSFKEISKYYKKTDFFFVSTSRGILSNQEVFFYGLGGLVLIDNLNFK